MVKYLYITVARFKHDLRPIKNHPIKNTTHTRKSPYKQNLSHYRRYHKQNRQTERKTKPKTPTDSRQKSLESLRTHRRIYPNAHTKRKAPQSEKTPYKAKRKAAHDPQTVNGYILVMFQQLAEKIKCYNY